MKRALVTAASIALLGMGLMVLPSSGQPLLNPFTFTMSENLDVDTSLALGNWKRAGEDGRITVSDGHFVDPAGQRFRIVGTTMQLWACFPDSATAIRMAKRLRALGINTVQFAQFDYTLQRDVSIFEDGATTLGGGLNEENMRRFDWFTHQLREHGIYYGLIFHSVWLPRAGDGVRQSDSVGIGARTMVFFDPVVQRIHRGIIKQILEHKNVFTQVEYKDDAALLYLMPIEEASMSIYWMFTQDIVRGTNQNNPIAGLEHHALIDSLYQEFLLGKGYTTDAALAAAWNSPPTNPVQQVRNGDFEDPFDQASWQFAVNTAAGAQAILQYTEQNVAAGRYSAHVFIGEPTADYGAITLNQLFTETVNKHKYRLSMKLRTSPEKGSRRVQILMFNGVTPFEGLQFDEFAITDEWTEYSTEFVAKTSNSNTPILQIRLGGESGDVFLDDVTYREVGIVGVRPGESITSRSVRRLMFADGDISEQRMSDQAAFYLSHQEQTLTAIRRLIQDTVGCGALLAPGRRLLDARDRYASRGYDFLCFDELRSGLQSSLDNGSSPSWIHSANNIEDKPYVVSGTNSYFPRLFQADMAAVLPSYAGLHDWDGIHFSTFANQPRAGSDRTEIGSNWLLFDKPHILTLLPAISNMMRRGDVQPSPKTLVISNNQSAINYPIHHGGSLFSLSLGADGRMGMFRRLVMDSELQDEESFLPHLEISALSGMVDVSALNAENDQIFYDQTRGILRVLAPKSMIVSGRLAGQIISEGDLIVEQVSAGMYTTVVLSSLTDSAILASPKNLLVIGTRGVNAGAVFSGNNSDLADWGQGPMQIEGRSMRITLRAPEWDSCFVTPLGADARPMTDKRRSITRSPTGRFSIAVETNVDGTPWYQVEFANIPTSVSENESVSSVSVAPNPVSDGSITVRHTEAAANIEVVDISGAVVRMVQTTGGVTHISTEGLAPGVYGIRIDGGRGGTARLVVY